MKVHTQNVWHPLNTYNCPATFIHGPETYPSCKYWFQISNTSLMGSSLLLSCSTFYVLYHQNIVSLNILISLIFLKRGWPSCFIIITHFYFHIYEYLLKNTMNYSPFLFFSGPFQSCLYAHWPSAFVHIWNISSTFWWTNIIKDRKYCHMFYKKIVCLKPLPWNIHNEMLWEHQFPLCPLKLRFIYLTLPTNSRVWENSYNIWSFGDT